MSTQQRCLGVIPARGGSKGLPGKNLRPFCGRPLIEHTIEFARLVPELDRTIVSTDSVEIAAVARACGGDVAFMRPTELAQDDTPMLPVIAHALQAIEEQEGARYDLVVLLDPTSPGRRPEHASRCVELLAADCEAVGVLSVSAPRFNPLWVCVVERDGEVRPAFDTGRFNRRQDVPRCYRINGAVYVWRRDWLLSAPGHWTEGRHLGMEMPERFAISIDDEEELALAEMLVESGMIRLPWLGEGDAVDN